MTYRITGNNKAEALFEISVDINGNRYLVIYGNHINGGFCCITSHNVACEMGEPSDISYNTEALVHSKVPKNYAKALADAIREANMVLTD